MKPCPKDVICVESFIKSIDFTTGKTIPLDPNVNFPKVDEVYRATRMETKSIGGDFYYLEGFPNKLIFTIRAFRDLDEINISELEETLKTEEICI